MNPRKASLGNLLVGPGEAPTIPKKGYSVLAAFRGKSSLRSYLTTVIQRRFLDQRRKEWGKWRPSAEAQRRGPLALQLERLLYREGLAFEHAVETLRANFSCRESREGLTRLARLIPARTPRPRRVEAETLVGAVADSELASPETRLEGTRTSNRAQALLQQVLEALPPQDRLVLRLRFEDNVSVADISRVLRVDQRLLYRRIDEILRRFYNAFEANGLCWSDIVRMIERGQCHLRLSLLENAASVDQTLFA